MSDLEALTSALTPLVAEAADVTPDDARTVLLGVRRRLRSADALEVFGEYVGGVVVTAFDEAFSCQDAHEITLGEIADVVAEDLLASAGL